MSAAVEMSGFRHVPLAARRKSYASGQTTTFSVRPKGEGLVVRSKIRLLCLRHRGVLPAIVFMDVFAADEVRPRAHGGPIGDGRRPGHREDAFILDRKMELQHLAPVVGVEFPTPAGAEIF